ncbi:hypothetical protein ACSLBF_10035 [Pseudoalteromonas sp. T1lg65]|uniref:hypothetical protein n=1 Tax=Pseudoalteromonas sp. T1lg65 TaxID=2077101 RepID=UPI003F7A71F4
MKTKIKVLTGKILFELTIVALGILLAIGINSQFQAYQENELANSHLKKIQYEITSNLKNLKEVNNTFGKNIELSDSYISQLQRGEKVELNYSINILSVDFGVWKVSQHREELDQLPVELLISISESYRALEKAELYTLELTLSKIPRMLDNDIKSETFEEILNELNYAKFYLDIAQMKLKKCVDAIEKYHSS